MIWKRLPTFDSVAPDDVLLGVIGAPVMGAVRSFSTVSSRRDPPIWGAGGTGGTGKDDPERA